MRSGLGCKERIVDALNVFLRDSGTGVGDADADGFAVRRAHAERAAFRHGVFGVQKEIQENLLETTRITLDRGQVLRCSACGSPARLAGGDEIMLDRIELEVP